MTDKIIKETIKEFSGRGSSVVKKRLQEIDTGVYANVVAVGGVEGDITLTGDLVVDTLGTLGDSSETDSDAVSATIPALLRGQLAHISDILTASETLAGTVFKGTLTVNDNNATSALSDLLTAIGNASDSAGDPTVIGLLKQIAENTGA